MAARCRVVDLANLRSSLTWTICPRSNLVDCNAKLISSFSMQRCPRLRSGERRRLSLARIAGSIQGSGSRPESATTLSVLLVTAPSLAVARTATVVNGGPQCAVDVDATIRVILARERMLESKRVESPFCILMCAGCCSASRAGPKIAKVG